LEAAQRQAAAAAYQAVARHQTITRDSAEAWVNGRRGVYYSDPRILMGTVTALISTGDLGLLRDPAVRQAVAAYATQIREDREEFDRAVAFLLASVESLRALGFRQQQEVATGGLPSASTATALTGSPGRDALHALDGVLISNDIRVIYLRPMLETNDRLRELVQSQ
jgi:hypothetical protein